MRIGYNKICCLCLLLLLANVLKAQELQANVQVLANRVSTQVDRKIFVTLQTALNNFINSRKWTTDNWQTGERIKCNFLINIDQELGNNTYRATVTVQSGRPIYQSAVETSIVNFQDPDVVFRYQEFQPLEFNENRVQGNDPVVANLPAVIAYYCYLIIGLDYNSFGLQQGKAYLQKAQNIVNNAPEGRDVAGWRPFDGLRNRYWLSENLTNNRYNLVHDIYYQYHRNGLDQLYSNLQEGKKAIYTSLQQWESFAKDNPNLMITQFFFQSKSAELINLYKGASKEEKQLAYQVLSKLDLTNAGTYKQLLQ